jgi:GAF domain-containing protein
MTRAYFNVMGAALTLITEDQLITKSFIGTLEGDMPRETTFCHQTIGLDRTLVITDTLEDPLFRDSPFVTGPPFIRFYAGHPIQGPGNKRIGALCIIDNSPRSFSAEDKHKLRTLAALVQLEIWAPAHQPR